MYEHHCRDCDLDWLEEHKVSDVDAFRNTGRYPSCPECESEDTYIAVTDSGIVVFKGGGWSPEGYGKHGYLDKYKDQGVKVYDRKEDHDREAKGEAEQAELKKLKHLDRVAKRTMGPDAGVTQSEADAAIKKAGEDRVK
jgi:hypothetical protein